ncbi:MAG TPA: Asp-tRNA(Asn)/Glu-tRNA(Gln) amidotransferase subunit GatB [Thermoanaerobaculia bacterium]|nr:Asp-tRNA(Asn)/Glu-tRNA(Gln) amidotransferase subunit GatB [Thermoanaerobaculia bacterium]
MAHDTVVGLEVHVQLATETKIFCRCPNRFGGEPNSRVCPVCLGYPGTLPVLNPRAVDLAVRLALALGCRLHPRSVFARKNYFYPDLPKGYQISQYREPLAEWGSMPLATFERRVTIRRLHLEEDAGKLLHETPGGGVLPGESLVDFNRCGVPLVEIVTEPDLHGAAEAQDFMQSMHQVLLYTGVSDANLEEGSLRCDANVSLRRSGAAELGSKVEIKNLNSFRHLARAIEYEVERQTALLEGGRDVESETRSFDASSGTTRPLRSKEEAHDYRYFPEPDLLPLWLDEKGLVAQESALPELPWELRARFQTQYGLDAEEAALFAAHLELARYFEQVAALTQGSPRAAANWVRTEVLRELNLRGAGSDAAPAPRRLARLIGMVDDQRLSSTGAKQVFLALWDGEEEPEGVSERLGLLQVRDEAQLRGWVDAVAAEHPAAVAQLQAGESKVLGFLVGQVMRRSAGRADPVLARRQLEELAGAAAAGAGAAPAAGRDVMP